MNVDKLKSIYKKLMFQPSLIAIFINPFYFCRKGLYHSILDFSAHFKGDILDFGCGQKPYKNLFAHVNSYIGVDYENEGHPHHNEDIEYFYNGKTLPFEDNKFDGIIASEVLEHVEHIDIVIKELSRVIKKGGKIIITVPFTFIEHEMPYDFRRYTINGIINILEKNNFEIIKSIKSSNNIETLIQLTTINIYSFFPSMKYFRIILTLILIFPLNLLGVLLGMIIPSNDKFYLNSIILASKR